MVCERMIELADVNKLKDEVQELLPNLAVFSFYWPKNETYVIGVKKSDKYYAWGVKEAMTASELIGNFGVTHER
jgi:hypothetical protein